jgi:hypothetical protein
MADSAHNSDAILAAARASLNDQRAGGRRVTGKPIGQRSAALRRSGQKRKAAAMALSVVVAFMLVNLLISLLSGVLHLIGWLASGAGVALLVALIWALMRNRDVAVPSLEKLRVSPRASWSVKRNCGWRRSAPPCPHPRSIW